MKRLDAHIGSSDTALEQTPEIFNSVCVNLAINVLRGVVNDFVLVLALQSLVASQLVAVEDRSSLNMFLDHRLNRIAMAIRHNLSANLSATFQKPHDGSL